MGSSTAKLYIHNYYGDISYSIFLFFSNPKSYILFSGQHISSVLVFSGTRSVNPDVMVCAHDVTLGHPLILREYIARKDKT